MKIEIDYEAIDGIVRAGLRDHLKTLVKPKFPSTHPDDIVYEKKIIKAIRLVLKHYGG